MAARRKHLILSRVLGFSPGKDGTALLVRFGLTSREMFLLCSIGRQRGWRLVGEYERRPIFDIVYQSTTDGRVDQRAVSEGNCMLR